mmetsp:Transcript_39529/g.61638  ORF Transcript_39529/g.61638 Transcript_39529/m.61638 type:complete len:93 (+) Transcript_39529:896-1174(+)
MQGVLFSDDSEYQRIQRRQEKRQEYAREYRRRKKLLASEGGGTSEGPNSALTEGSEELSQLQLDGDQFPLTDASTEFPDSGYPPGSSVPPSG